MTHNGYMENELGNFPESLQDAVLYFSDVDKAHKFATKLRWPNGVECPRCRSKEHSFISTRRIWFCKGCKKQFTVKVGSIFEDSPLGMDKWMLAVWMIVSCKNGISSYEIANHLGITQKSAWHMMHRVRRAMQSGSFAKFSGEVEVDETFIGGKARNMHVAQRQRRRRDRIAQVEMAGDPQRRGAARLRRPGLRQPDPRRRASLAAPDRRQGVREMTRPNDGTLDRREVVATLLRDPGDYRNVLRDLGRETAAAWLHYCYDDVGKRTTIDLADMYL